MAGALPAAGVPYDGVYTDGMPEMAPHVMTLDPPVTDLIAGQLQAMVFDFDQTILHVHSFGEAIQPADVPRRDWRADFADLDMFKELCTALVERGVKVAVASFGRKDVIRTYLDLAFEDEREDVFPDAAICTPSDVGPGIEDGMALEDGKNTQLRIVEARLRLDPARRGAILFVDDDQRNCKLAAREGYLAFWCPRAFGREAWRRAHAGLAEAAGKSAAPAATSAAAAYGASTSAPASPVAAAGAGPAGDGLAAAAGPHPMAPAGLTGAGSGAAAGALGATSSGGISDPASAAASES